MTNTTTTPRLYSTSRRNVLRGMGAAGAFSVFGLPAFSGMALADEHGSSIDLACELDIMLAVDASGSLSSADAVALQDGVNAFVNRLPDDGTVQVGSLEFAAGEVRKLNGLQAPDSLAVSVATNPRGDTPMPGALDIADQILYGDAAARPTAGKLIVMFTDGGPNYETKWSDPINYTLGGYNAPRDDTTDWSAVGGNFVYDNDDGGIANVSEGEMDETALVAGSIKNGSLGGGATAIATVYVNITGNLTNAMTADAITTYTDLPTYLENHIATTGLAIDGELANIETLVDDLVAAINENCDDCVDCTLEENVKYEFACVETDPDTGDCVAWDFVLEDEGDSGITYTPESFAGKEGDMSEPMSVDFETDYCDLYVLVKSGQEFEVQSFDGNDGSITVETANDEKYAISFVQFFCTEAEAEAALEAFPSRGKGKGR